MMWILLMLVTFLSSVTWAHAHNCETVISDCQENDSWTRCFEDRIGSCRQRLRKLDFFRTNVKSSEVAEVGIIGHSVHIPSSALQMSRGHASEEEVLLVVTLVNSTYFKPTRPRGRGRKIEPPPPAQSGFILRETVLVVRAGNIPVKNLSQPVKLIFKHNKLVPNGVCVFWQESEGVPSNWSTEGCDTTIVGTDYICSCNHLSFFAVLVNPILTVDTRSAEKISYINYIGSALSVFFTAVTLIIYIFLQRRRPEKAIGVHIQLTLALFCLHLIYLLSSLTVTEDGRICKALGLVLHWSLLATFTWTVLEGFHLYLLLVRVFNIYVRRYLLKLSLVGWGIPTLVVTVCGILGVYGRFTVNLSDDNTPSQKSSPDLIGQICWVSSQFPQKLLVIFITAVAFPCLVILYNSCMLGVVLFKMWGLRKGDGAFGGDSSWKKIDKQRRSRLWKDATTVLGLSCVLGLPWGLAATTYFSSNILPGVYIFTVLNSLQGVFMFLWCLALSCKSQSNNNSSVRDPSSQRMMDTSF
ncbi:adhesion G protein-coupled receptor G3 [Sphaeramia orbicularis]|uniref:Adhesion G protein-coupled receptor G3-like n=1 Tax=Sphaeramia orbicularis TaxID=375764 RepID=A0A672YKE4_9TELE|nr:adhesion G protein-coupled receptor G3-like [Sphaeramia orbicularis]